MMPCNIRQLDTVYYNTLQDFKASTSTLLSYNTRSVMSTLKIIIFQRRMWLHFKPSLKSLEYHLTAIAQCIITCNFFFSYLTCNSICPKKMYEINLPRKPLLMIASKGFHGTVRVSLVNPRVALAHDNI